MIEAVLKKMGFSQKPLSVSQFRCEEDNSLYRVWRIDYPDQALVLKQTKGQELSVYQTYLSDHNSYAPRLYASAELEGTDYLLMEYIPGNDLTRCNRQNLITALDSLIAMQSRFWGADKAPSALDSRENRRKYLNSDRLKRAYDAYLEDCGRIPATLCHDDLLPFNVIVSENRAVFIDWEVGGILPYPTSLARLIGHTEDREDAFFYMTESDKAFAIDYYFVNFIKNRGVPYEAYRRSLDLCLFYEYCEWVYVGNKFGDTANDRYSRYLKLAADLAGKLGF